MLLSLIATTFAQDPAENTDEPLYAAETHIEFGYTRVDGKLVGPNGQIFVEPAKLVFTPMIKLRINFDEEMDASVAQVK
ncbi:MAG: hypothetical protein GY913_09565 [Proteobacteria bacterium]|nr:hypothetical protein [Pseudomonadota bacterium]MCP4917159.1 hypothetical protein [Pseudomonadota bacterium]